MNKKKQRKPRRWWVTIDSDGVIWDSFGSRQDARDHLDISSEQWRKSHGMHVIRVEEVLPKKPREER
jgi:hypothetical protein